MPPIQGPMTKLFSALLAISLAGCGIAPQTSLVAKRSTLMKARSLTAESLYPLEPGARWQYQTTSRSGDDPERPGPVQVFTLVQVGAASGSMQAVMERRFGDRQMPSTLIERTSDSVTLSRYQKPEDGSITVLKWPLTPGASWPGRTWPQAQETIQYAGTESIRVPAGTYEAARMDHLIRYQTGSTDELHYWYAPGVGMVKAIEGLTVDLGQGPVLHQVTCELTSYAVASGSVGLEP
ncbi:MAG TPA: hypothetical protein V6D05_09420 [Stenomitos sp.]